MKLSEGLYEILKERLSWSKPRVECLVELVIALFRVQDVNLARLAVALEGESLVSSRYRRLQRFFAQMQLDADVLARLVVSIFGWWTQSFYLTLDRTNWKWGHGNLNILTLGIAYRGAAIPLYWTLLDKQGNSDQAERIALVQRFIRQFGRERVLGLLADREFIGEVWWRWLLRQRIPFWIRIKESQLAHDQGQTYALKRLFESLRVGESRCIRRRLKVSECSVYLSALRLDSGELLILAASHKRADPFKIYQRRWEIENLFQCLKGRGFHLESTHLTHPDRISMMMAVVTLGFCWAHKTGEWKDRFVNPLNVKSHGRREHSLFRYGLDELADALLGATVTGHHAVRLLFLFLCPPDWMEVKKGKLQLIDLHKGS